MSFEFPREPKDPRPGNLPFYISPNCENCETLLVLYDVFDPTGIEPDEIFNDEFICPKCVGGVYLDTPPDEGTSGFYPFSSNEEGG